MIDKIENSNNIYFDTPYWVDISATDYPGDMQIWDKINDWCCKNCLYKWVVGTRVISQNPIRILPWYMCAYYFENIEDAMAFKLKWICPVEIALLKR